MKPPRSQLLPPFKPCLTRIIGYTPAHPNLLERAMKVKPKPKDERN